MSASQRHSSDHDQLMSDTDQLMSDNDQWMSDNDQWMSDNDQLRSTCTIGGKAETSSAESWQYALDSLSTALIN